VPDRTVLVVEDFDDTRAMIRGLLGGCDSEGIMDAPNLIASLEAAPGIIIGLVREVPWQNLKRRPAPNKWSAHEHACHISTGHTACARPRISESPSGRN
jgi:hypothetical protein